MQWIVQPWIITVNVFCVIYLFSEVYVLLKSLIVLNWWHPLCLNGTSEKIWPLFELNTFKYHVLCIDGKISVRINLLFYQFFIVVPSNTCVFLSCRPFLVITTFSTGLVGVEVSSVSWLGQTLKTCWKCCISNERSTG